MAAYGITPQPTAECLTPPLKIFSGLLIVVRGGPL
jgi:hypothetical protein